MEDIVIKEYTNQELSQAEKMKLDIWLSESPKNRKVYAQMKLALTYPDTAHRARMEEEVWKNLKTRFSADQYKPNDRSSSLSNLVWLRVAAVLILCLSAILMLHQAGYVNPFDKQGLVEVKVVEKVSLPGQKITTKLPDGTTVKLNADSKLLVPEFFTGDKREVKLIGEAFFDVARDETRPFIIKTSDLEIEVLGTSFNVSAYEDATSRSVSVKSGKVAVKSYRKGTAVELEPNEMGILAEEGQLLKKPIENENLVFGWIEQQIVFKDQPIERVLNTISRWYGVEVEFEKQIRSERLYTASYENPVLREVMESIAHVYNFNYEINGKKIVIK